MSNMCAYVALIIVGLACGTKLLGAHGMTGLDAVAKQEGAAKRRTGLVVSLQ